MLREVLSAAVMEAMSAAGHLDEADFARLVADFEGVYFAKGAIPVPEKLGKLSVDEVTELLYQKAVETYEKREAAFTPEVTRELERVVMLRVVDEYWMENIDAMDDLKQGIGLRAYGQHDPVVAYKEEGYQMFEAMIQAIREETVRRMFLVQLRPTQEVKRERVAKETGTGAAVNAQVKKQPVRKEKKAGPNDPCPCGSGLKYKKCCMQKDKNNS